METNQDQMDSDLEHDNMDQAASQERYVIQK